MVRSKTSSGNELLAGHLRTVYKRCLNLGESRGSRVARLDYLTQEDRRVLALPKGEPQPGNPFVLLPGKVNCRQMRTPEPSLRRHLLHFFDVELPRRHSFLS